ncbi:MAG: TauD/TfdA family dioxygenase [Bacteroidota bacterium]
MKVKAKYRTTALRPDWGLVVNGLDLHQPLDATTATQLQALLQQHQLLVIKGHSALEPAQQVAFSKVFGTLETFPYNGNQLKAFPEVFRLSTDRKKGYQNVGFYWHQDGSFKPQPTAISIFHLVDLPTNGGATLFANAHQVYDLLPKASQAIAKKLKTRDRGGVVHDLVIQHPFTGREAIYLNMGLTDQIFATSPLERTQISNLLQEIENIFAQATIPYTHHWEKGDVVVADNYAVFHQATAVEGEGTRTLHRTTIEGQHALNR